MLWLRYKPMWLTYKPIGLVYTTMGLGYTPIGPVYKPTGPLDEPQVIEAWICMHSHWIYIYSIIIIYPLVEKDVYLAFFTIVYNRIKNSTYHH